MLEIGTSSSMRGEAKKGRWLYASQSVSSLPTLLKEKAVKALLQELLSRIELGI